MSRGEWLMAAWVGAGGAIGSSLRFLVSGWAQRLAPGAGWPWGTLTVNVLGCLLLGLLGGVAESRQVLGPTARAFLLIGVLGGFTTFSTFAYETLGLAQDSTARAAANVAAHLLLGLAAAGAGYAAGRAL